ncbi:hypothetical protein DLAC_11808 [Tieghemostelium lacteum]|uniref:Uncharacterized protein n=1 Tax=Tieghemostelium lacteum TaxID=361077 RepID=A0A151Z5A7_TIELA|nr:hypothetical protein DLAC_11808 [Tieghemostelium lacteum]|eukprot:KYQ89150.1 hypothetical protein DLAC_11808 [Tieghemostelium lacteum]
MEHSMDFIYKQTIEPVTLTFDSAYLSLAIFLHEVQGLVETIDHNSALYIAVNAKCISCFQLNINELRNALSHRNYLMNFVPFENEEFEVTVLGNKMLLKQYEILLYKIKNWKSQNEVLDGPPVKFKITHFFKCAIILLQYWKTLKYTRSK